jgi:MYXO-CTERM domain-containing protein
VQRSLVLAVVLGASTASAQTVATVAARGQCSTAGVEALSRQLVETQSCLLPGAFVSVTPRANITLSASRLFPFAQASTRDAMWAAATTTPLQINSMFRTLADQYVLYFSRACGLAARPGSSNHETGTAVDLGNWSQARSAMLRAGCRHPYPGTDDVHFDCPGTDRRSDSIRTFQRLWNVNNPSDRLTEDGAYGPLTESRLGRSPAAGFARNGCDTTPPTPALAATLVRVSCPAEAVAGSRPVAFVEYRNTGTATWQAPGTRLGTTGPRDRRGAFYDTANWVAPNRPSTVDAPTAPGATGRFSFVLGIPEVTTAQTVTDTYALVQEGVGWFGPADDAVRCAVRVTPRVVDAGAADATADVPVDVAVVDAPDAGDAWDDGDSPDAGDAWADASDAADAVAEAGDGGATFGDEGDPEAIEGGCQCRAGSPTGKARPGPFVLLAALGMALRRRRRRGRP